MLGIEKASATATQMIFLETERLFFRTHEAGDEEEFVRMNTDAEVRRFVGGQAWSTEKAVQRFRDEYLGEPSETYGMWATILKAEGKYIGYCGLRAGNAVVCESASIGFYLARPYWRQGFATEAAKGLLEVAFERLGLRRVGADVQKGNAGSERILENLGFSFVKEEVLVHNGRVICSYEISSADWKNGRR